MTDNEGREPEPLALGRRTVLQGAALTGAVAVLGSCSSDGAAPTPVQSDGPLAATADIPVNGGLIIDQAVVVTQPEAGTFRAFSAICTHKGCPVHDVTDGVINCTCHGSQYSVSDGSVLAGPAPSPLPEVPVQVTDGQVVRA